MSLPIRLRSRLLAAAAAGLLGATALVALAPPGTADAATSQFHGVNWADPNDNFSNGVVVPSGLASSDSYSTTAAKAAGILDGFASFGANTVRLPVNPSSVGTAWWGSYTGAIDTALQKNFKVILGYWEGTPHDGKIDDTTAWNSMWDTVIAKYGTNASVYFEPMNEPYGYSATDWANTAAGWLQRYPNLDRTHVFISGVGYNGDASGLCTDSRFANVIFTIHQYAFFANHDYNGWVQTLKNAVGGCASRAVLDEYGAPTTTGLDYDGGSTGHSTDDNNYIALIQGMTNTVRSLGMGAVYWPGLWINDGYSLTTLQGSGTNLSLSINNQSAIDRLRDAWGIGAVQVIGQGSGRCLDVPGFATTSTATSIYDCNGGGNQRWTFTNGQLVGYSGLCLDAQNASVAVGTAIVTYPCNNGSNQQWTLKADGSIVGMQSGLCLDVKFGATANGSSLILYTCNGGSNQKWTKV